MSRPRLPPESVSSRIITYRERNHLKTNILPASDFESYTYVEKNRVIVIESYT
jgi:hypothetical protein